MRILALGVLMLAMGGCATAGEQEMTRMTDTAKLAVAVADDCWSRAQAQDGYVALASKLTLKYGPPTATQLADGGKPMPDERQTLSDLYRDWITPCRKAVIDGAVAALPPLHHILLRYAEREDTVFAALIQGRLSWGDANSQLAAIRLETNQATREIADRVEQHLRHQHAEEVEARDAALSALGGALVQFGNQQMAAERQRQWQRQWEQRQSTPRQTICQNVGGWLSCTTY
jgi:hypothetical protein